MGGQQSDLDVERKSRFLTIFIRNYQIGQYQINRTFGSVQLCLNKNTHQVQIIKKLIDTDAATSNLVTTINDRISFPVPNLLSIYHLQISDVICSDSKVIEIYFQYIKKSLSFQLKTRRKHIYYFSEEQLWKILISLINAIQNYHARNVCHMEVSLENVLIEDNYQIKLIDKVLLDEVHWAFSQDSHTVKLIKKEGVLFNSDILKFITNKCVPQLMFDLFKADVFAVGMIVLECVRLKPNDIYDYKNFTINLEEIKNSITEGRQKYSFQLMNIIKQMLEDSDYNRPNSNQLYDKIKNVPFKTIRGLSLSLSQSLFQTFPSKASV